MTCAGKGVFHYQGIVSTIVFKFVFNSLNSIFLIQILPRFINFHRRKSAPSLRPDISIEAKEDAELVQEKEAGKLDVQNRNKSILLNLSELFFL